MLLIGHIYIHGAGVKDLKKYEIRFNENGPKSPRVKATLYSPTYISNMYV